MLLRHRLQDSDTPFARAFLKIEEEWKKVGDTVEAGQAELFTQLDVVGSHIQNAAADIQSSKTRLQESLRKLDDAAAGSKLNPLGTSNFCRRAGDLEVAVARYDLLIDQFMGLVKLGETLGYW